MNTSHDQHGALQVVLRDILSTIKPLEEDVATRVHIINELTSVVKSMESLRGATVEPFGSFISNLYTRWGDLDISIEVENGSDISSAGKNRKVKLLGNLMRALRKRGVARHMEFIRNARIPVLKFKSNLRNISCDISICNLRGQIKSKLLCWIADIDERFRDMVLLVKEWAKTQSINDPKTGTLNSYSLALLVIFHFQTCKPAILPPLHEIYPGNITDYLTGVREIVENSIQEMCATNITRFRTSSVSNLNESSLPELFISFFQKFSRINAMAAEHVICTYTGQWELRRSNDAWMAKTYPLLIEDPFEQPDNTARAVTTNHLLRIAEAFASTYSILSGNQDQSSLIDILVESHIRSKLCKGTPANRRVSGGFARRPQYSSAVITNQHQFQNVRLETRPRTFFAEREQVFYTAPPTQNQVQNMQFGTLPSHNNFSQRPQFSNPMRPTQNRFQNMQFDTYPNHDVFSQRPQFCSGVRSVSYQHQNMQPDAQSTSSASSQRPGQTLHGRGQQTWRPRYSNR